VTGDSQSQKYGIYADTKQYHRHRAAPAAANNATAELYHNEDRRRTRNLHSQYRQ